MQLESCCLSARSAADASTHGSGRTNLYLEPGTGLSPAALVSTHLCLEPASLLCVAVLYGPTVTSGDSTWRLRANNLVITASRETLSYQDRAELRGSTPTRTLDPKAEACVVLPGPHGSSSRLHGPTILVLRSTKTSVPVLRG